MQQRRMVLGKVERLEESTDTNKIALTVQSGVH